jgi:hypothetical protein
LRKVLLGLGVAVLVLLLLDVVARLYVQRRVEREFRSASQVDAESVDFSIDSFPFLGRLLAQGEVSATLRLEGIEEQGVRIDEFTVEVDELEFDRDRAFNGEVEVTGLDRATVTARFEGIAVEPQSVALPDYFPCRAEVEVGPEATVLSCTTDELPAVVNDVIGRATS